jgi:hypothetical protein
MQVLSSKSSPALGGHMNVRTKIVATVGPACEEPAMLEQLARAGVDVFRINMAHGSRQFHDEIVTRVRMVSQTVDRPLGILVDLAGPKIRLGELARDEVPCEVGAEFVFIRGDRATKDGELCSTYERLIDVVEGRRPRPLPCYQRRDGAQPPGHQPARRRAERPRAHAGRFRKRTLGRQSRSRFPRPQLRTHPARN